MIVKVNTGAVCGLEGSYVIVEADFSNGLPSFDVVGLPDATVRESKERVRSAIKNSGFDFPAKRAVINLAPADLKKEGTQFDLPIAVSILAGTGQLKASFDEYMFIGWKYNGTVIANNGTWTYDAGETIELVAEWKPESWTENY